MVTWIQSPNLSKSSLPDRVQHVTQFIRGAEHQYRRPSGSVELLAVSKARPAAVIRSVYKCGIRQFGESYPDEAISKQQQLTDLAICWHFVGRIQSNKTAVIAARFDWVHSIDRLKIAIRLNSQRPDHLPALNICIQVNVDREPSKGGIIASEIQDLTHQVRELPRLRLRGLMCIPAPRQGLAAQRRPFALLAELFNQANDNGADLDTLSMGMTNDAEAAIAEGATMVRLGTALFGLRTE